MSTTLERPAINRVQFSGGFPEGIFISSLQEQVTMPQNDWQTKLGFWKFGVNLVQKMEQERLSAPEAEFERAYVGMILLLLTLGHGLVEEIKDPVIADHVKANLENLNSKYFTFKMPPPETKNNRLIDLIAA